MQFSPPIQKITTSKYDKFFCVNRETKTKLFPAVTLKTISICVPHFSEDSFAFAARASELSWLKILFFNICWSKFFFFLIDIIKFKPEFG